MKEIVAAFLMGVFVSVVVTSEYHEHKYLKIDKKITQEMKKHPTKYKDEFSFGYNIGLIKCSSLVYDVKKGK